MKRCYTCKTDKDKSEFNKNKGRKDGLNSICKECSRERSKRYYRENKEYHKKVTTARKKIQIEKSRKYVYSYLCKNPCVDCGENDPIVLEFDHMRDKHKNLSRMIVDGNSIDSIKKEIEKCEVRCANCHRRKTAKDQGWYMLDLRAPVVPS